MPEQIEDSRCSNLVRQLVAEGENEWIEFKQNNTDPHEIGEYISALANSAVLAEKTEAYIIWGIDDKTRKIVGTKFRYRACKIGNEPLENWLSRLLEPKVNFYFDQIRIDDQDIVVLTICCAIHKPTSFDGCEYIRIGSTKKKLKEHDEKERKLWKMFDKTPFERQIAVSDVDARTVLHLLEYNAYFDLLNKPIPASETAVIKDLTAQKLIIPSKFGRWDITNLAAILLARELENFSSLRRKASRVILYKGNSRVVSISAERVGLKGYANGFEGLIAYINRLLPHNEVIGQALRKEVPVYPELAVRELIANALIHQDFSIKGTGPMIEIFDNRMEITNPGKPLIKPDRFLDAPPCSRNEDLAALMRQFGVCEERGSGIDKVIAKTEEFQLPAPLFEVIEDSHRVTLFSPKKLSKMDRNDRIRACYQHACLRYVNHEQLTNASIRQRFGIKEENITLASRYIKEALDAKVIILYDEAAPPKVRKYVPYWIR